jgi:LPS sulfotransferase NodH
MNMLHQTGVAGVADYINCGFFIGYYWNWNKNHSFENRCLQYLNKQKTPNGVIGCKGGMSYFDEYRTIVGDLKVDRLLDSFTHHIWLQRQKKVEQAVSRIVAASTKIWSTIQIDKGIDEFSEPVYSRKNIDDNIAKIADENKAIEDFFTDRNITPHIVYYEDIVKSAPSELSKIIQYLGITEPYVFKQATIRKQIDSRKDEFIRLYESGE